jgi:adenine-specific DNA-methyltransferase
MTTENEKVKTLDEAMKKIVELQAEIKKVKKQKKYGLVWEDKKEQIVEDCKRNVPILRLKEKKKGIEPVVTTEKTKDENILIEGDNYHALSVLNYTHKGKFKVIYADPPYNTGNKSWKYNNDYVEKDDAFKHSKWVSYIDNRLNLTKNLLTEDGIIIFAIDDYEAHTLRLLMDEVFGQDNRLGTAVVIHNPGGRQDEMFFATAHEYMLVYAKDREKASVGLLNYFEEKNKSYQYSDDVSTYKLREFRRSGANSRRTDRPNLWYPIYVNSKTLEISTFKNNKWDVVLPIDNDGTERVWRWNAKTLEEKKDTYINVKKYKDGYRFYVKERSVDYKGEKPKTIWFRPEYSAVNGTSALKEIFSENLDKIFDFPKSPFLMQDILSISGDSDCWVLDFFAGSGTTGHAVLELNKKDGGDRKFILCTNNENNICEEVTYERVTRVMKGYKNKKGEKVEGLGGNLRYYKTDLVDIEKLHRTPDHAKVKLTYQAGEMIGLRENTLNEVEKNEWWQIFEGNGKSTAIYFKEDKEKLLELVELLEKKKTPAVLYIFSWGKNEYKSEYSGANIRVEDIPEPILEVYKEINRL